MSKRAGCRFEAIIRFMYKIPPNRETSMKMKRICGLPLLLLIMSAFVAPPVTMVHASDSETKKELLLNRLKIRAQNCAKIQRMQCVFACARSMSLLNQGKLEELQVEMKKCKA